MGLAQSYPTAWVAFRSIPTVHAPRVRKRMELGAGRSDGAAAGRRRSDVSEVGTILEQWRESGVKWVRFELPDMHGNSRSKTIPIEHAGSLRRDRAQHVRGSRRPGHAVRRRAGTLYHEERGYGDQLLFPDPDTAAVVPWADRTARFICDAPWYDGTPLAHAAPCFSRALEQAPGWGSTR